MSGSSIIKSFIWSFLEQGGSKIVQMLVQLILARLLSPEAFGTLAILLVLTNIADAIAQSGLGMALIQQSDSSDESYSTAWWLSMGFALVLYAVFFFSAPWVALFYGMPELSEYLRVLGVIVFFNSANSIQRSHLQRSMDFKSIFKATTLAAVLSGVVGILLALIGIGVWALIAQTLMQSIAVCVAMWVQLPWRPRFVFLKREARELYAYGWKICVTSILNVFYTGVSELVIGKACTSAELGFYSQGRKYPNAAIGMITNAVSNVLFPAFSRVKDDQEKFLLGVKKSLTLGMFIVTPVSLLFASIAEPLVAILLTEKWLPCAPIFQLACIGNVAGILQIVNLRAYMALGRSDLYMNLQIIKVSLGVVFIGGTALLTHDVYCTAIMACIIGYTSVLLVDLHPAKKVIGYSCLCQVRDQFPTVVAGLIAFWISYIVGFAFANYGLAIAVQSIVFSAVYMLIVVIQKNKAISDLDGLFRKVIQRKSR